MDRLVITAGHATAEEVAAVTAALAGISAAAAPPAAAAHAPAWARAARIEAVGQAPFVNARDARLAGAGYSTVT